MCGNTQLQLNVINVTNVLPEEIDRSKHSIKDGKVDISMLGRKSLLRSIASSFFLIHLVGLVTVLKCRTTITATVIYFFPYISLPRGTCY